MNREGYRTPTEDAAIARETRREKLRQKYGIKEGEVIRMMITIPKAVSCESAHEEVREVRIKEIHEHHITIRRPSGIVESFGWNDFEKRRR